jgi:hypothetical protein
MMRLTRNPKPATRNAQPETLDKTTKTKLTKHKI